MTRLEMGVEVARKLLVRYRLPGTVRPSLGGGYVVISLEPIRWWQFRKQARTGRLVGALERNLPPGVSYVVEGL